MEIKIRKDRMTKWERWEALLNYQQPDRVPVWSFGIGFNAVYTGLSIVDAYTNPAKVVESVETTTRDFGWQDLPYIGMASLGAWELGGEVRMPSSKYDQAPIVERIPINSIEDAYNLQVPADITKVGMVPAMLEAVRLQAEKGYPLITGMTISPWQLAANASGVERWMRWIMKNPEVPHMLMEKLVPFVAQLIKAYVDIIGADHSLIWVGGTATTSNQLISPKIFRDFYLPYQKLVHKQAKEVGLKHIFNHICGEQNRNLEYWAELDFGDPGFLSFGHEIDLEKAGEYFPKAVIIGNLEPAIIVMGTPEEVYQATKKVIEKGKRLGPHRFMFAPGCELPPRSPVENIWAMMQAVSDYGWYE